MTDKIITTFETTITWFFTTDILPEHEDKVLVAFFDGDISDLATQAASEALLTKK